MTWIVFGIILLVASTACFGRVLMHAFGRSIGTGLMVLGIPCYVLVYAFSQFESRHKGWWISGMLGLGTLGIILQAIGLSLIRAPKLPPL
jgi:translocator protein